MILVGRYASPFVRRVGVVLHTLGTPFEHKGLSTATDLAAIKGYKMKLMLAGLVESLNTSWVAAPLS
jgi:hypothetical protein